MLLVVISIQKLFRMSKQYSSRYPSDEQSTVPIPHAKSLIKSIEPFHPLQESAVERGGGNRLSRPPLCPFLHLFSLRHTHASRFLDETQPPTELAELALCAVVHGDVELLAVLAAVGFLDFVQVARLPVEAHEAGDEQVGLVF